MWSMQKKPCICRNESQYDLPKADQLKIKNKKQVQTSSKKREEILSKNRKKGIKSGINTNNNNEKSVALISKNQGSVASGTRSHGISAPKKDLEGSARIVQNAFNAIKKQFTIERTRRKTKDENADTKISRNSRRIKKLDKEKPPKNPTLPKKQYNSNPNAMLKIEDRNTLFGKYNRRSSFELENEHYSTTAIHNSLREMSVPPGTSNKINTKLTIYWKGIGINSNSSTEKQWGSGRSNLNDGIFQNNEFGNFIQQTGDEYNKTLHNHSEQAMVFKYFDNNFSEIRTLINQKSNESNKSNSKIALIHLAIHSYPNTVCTNCDKALKRLHTGVVEKFKVPFVITVTAYRAFSGSIPKILKLKDNDEIKVEDYTGTLGGVLYRGPDERFYFGDFSKENIVKGMYRNNINSGMYKYPKNAKSYEY